MGRSSGEVEDLGSSEEDSEYIRRSYGAVGAVVAWRGGRSFTRAFFPLGSPHSIGNPCWPMQGKVFRNTKSVPLQEAPRTQRMGVVKGHWSNWVLLRILGLPGRKHAHNRRVLPDKLFTQCHKCSTHPSRPFWGSSLCTLHMVVIRARPIDRMCSEQQT